MTLRSKLWFELALSFLSLRLRCLPQLELFSASSIGLTVVSSWLSLLWESEGEVLIDLGATSLGWSNNLNKVFHILYLLLLQW